MVRIILVGCGNVGSRHLQAIAKLSQDITVDIVDPNKDSQKLAISRLNETKYDKSNHVFFWYESIEDLKNKSDLVIVSNSAIGRVNLIIRLLELGHSTFLIEKMVCQSVEEYDLLLSKMQKFNAKGWVNTNLRYFQAYRKIQEYCQDAGIIRLSVLANSSAGLSTNAIHYVDLFSWLVKDYEITLDGKFLSEQLLQNKRGQDFKEFEGTLVGSVSNGSCVVLTFISSYKGETVINISGNNAHFMINDTNEKMFVMIKNDIHEWEFKYEYVSNLTTSIVHDILTKDDCMLPTLYDLRHVHSEIFHVFNTHISKILKKDVKLCPIT